MKVLEQKYDLLKKILKPYGGIVVAFSGGADSTLLLKAAVDALKKKVVAVTITGEIYPPGETAEALQLARSIGSEHLLVENRDLDNPVFAGNPPDRCYHCKKYAYGKILEIARARGIKGVVDGVNADDLSDYRPGIRAGEELGVRSPLKEAGLNKEEIRALSRALKLPTADKPANPCLASRFPYGTKITFQGLRQVGAAEEVVRQAGVPLVRVRHHGSLARIEVPPEYIPMVIKNSTEIEKRIRDIGYKYITLDLRGYRMGSMNEALNLND